MPVVRQQSTLSTRRQQTENQPFSNNSPSSSRFISSWKLSSRTFLRCTLQITARDEPRNVRSRLTGRCSGLQDHQPNCATWNGTTPPDHMERNCNQYKTHRCNRIDTLLVEVSSLLNFGSVMNRMLDDSNSRGFARKYTCKFGGQRSEVRCRNRGVHARSSAKSCSQSSSPTAGKDASPSRRLPVRNTHRSPLKSRPAAAESGTEPAPPTAGSATASRQDRSGTEYGSDSTRLLQVRTAGQTLERKLGGHRLRDVAQTNARDGQERKQNAVSGGGILQERRISWKT